MATNIHGQQIPFYVKKPPQNRPDGTYGTFETNDQGKQGLLAFVYRGVEGLEYPGQYHCRIMVDPVDPASFYVIRDMEDKEIAGFEGHRFTSIGKAKDAWDSYVRGKIGYTDYVEVI